MRRMHVNKRKSANTFKHNVKKTKAANAAPMPMRGGYRL